jgi:dystonin
LQSFRNEVWRHSGEYENTRALGDTFLSSCDMDKEVVRNELANMKARWDALNNGMSMQFCEIRKDMLLLYTTFAELLERTQSLEDTARRLSDFTDNLRELQHSLTRCEDKLASHDALGGAAKDPKLLDRIKVKWLVINCHCN